MSTAEIDYLTKDFYRAISFGHSTSPDFTPVKILFYGTGILINNSFSKPITFTAESFIKAMESQVADGAIEQFMQRELHSKTEVFGKVAHRISVYEYNFADHEMPKLPRGINFIQFVQIEGHWRILSMAWSDENENHLIPEEYLH
ncbi:hypothetical protein [Mucilaginibacter sp. BT774]|uniref:hypothetical protein n=1 Tax=Mucilaginibacter sp. BT774 TaxID=3062276 RepID=UPI002675E69B|nr:hypothetical protein [Mucilaginibacter sp. BT774]MDO3625136.1 hypothetical protein [Mucilaginibacter sp. BT774]